jgi:hypothetical protein
MNDKRKIQVLCIDDSALIRSILKEIINAQPDMEVVGVAPDPIIARDLIKQTNPRCARWSWARWISSPSPSWACAMA